jgi:hypothetical protein
MDAQKIHRHILMGWAALNGLEPTYIDATALVASADPSLRNRKTSSGEPLWATGDPVYLTPAAYRDIATAILEVGAEMDEEAASSDAASLEGSFKRKRLESVVTRPTDNAK